MASKIAPTDVIVTNTIDNKRFINLFGTRVHFVHKGQWYAVDPVSPLRLDVSQEVPLLQEGVRYIVSYEVAHRRSHRQDLYHPKTAHLDEGGRVKYYTGLMKFKYATPPSSESEEESE